MNELKSGRDNYRNCELNLFRYLTGVSSSNILVPSASDEVVDNTSEDFVKNWNRIENTVEEATILVCEKMLYTNYT